MAPGGLSNKGTSIAKKNQAPEKNSAAQKKITDKAKLTALSSAFLSAKAAAKSAAAVAESTAAAADLAATALRKHRIGVFTERLDEFDLRPSSSNLKTRVHTLVNSACTSEDECVGCFALEQYEKFILLKAVNADHYATILSPSPMIDNIWRLHVLDTRSYLVMNQALFPRELGDEEQKFIHRDPNGGNDIAAHAVRIASTKREYEAYFGALGDHDSLKRLALNGKIWNFKSAPDWDDEESEEEESEKEEGEEEESEEDESEEEKAYHSLITVYVKTITGKMVTISINLSDPCKKIYQLVQASQGIPIDQMRLDFGLTKLADKSNATVHSHGIVEGSVIDLILKLRGC
jgi:hypothetical protein